MTCSNCEELRETIATLQETARKAGLAAQARQTLEMARRYMAEGDDVDSPRVLACMLEALTLAKELAGGDDEPVSPTAPTLPAPPEAA